MQKYLCVVTRPYSHIYEWEVPDVPLIKGTSSTEEDAKNDAHLVLSQWIMFKDATQLPRFRSEDELRSGLKPGEKIHRFAFVLDQGLEKVSFQAEVAVLQDFRELADRRGVPFNDLMNEALIEKLSRHEIGG